MARHQVAAQPVLGAQCFLQIDGAWLVKTSSFVQRLGRHLDAEAVQAWLQASNRHAGAIERDAVAQASIIEVAWRA